ncbi:MAG: hypothetical protein ACYS99_17935 [Planctomycetota bacterium]|jgi:hypothetical protein
MSDGTDLATAAGVLRSYAGYTVHGMATHKLPKDPLRAYILDELHLLYGQAPFPEEHRRAVFDWYRDERAVRGTGDQYLPLTHGPGACELLLEGLVSLFGVRECPEDLAARAALTTGLICADVLAEVDDEGDPRPSCRHHLGDAYRASTGRVRTLLRQIDRGAWPARTAEQRAELVRYADEIREVVSMAGVKHSHRPPFNLIDRSMDACRLADAALEELLAVSEEMPETMAEAEGWKDRVIEKVGVAISRLASPALKVDLKIRKVPPPSSNAERLRSGKESFLREWSMAQAETQPGVQGGLHDLGKNSSLGGLFYNAIQNAARLIREDLHDFCEQMLAEEHELSQGTDRSEILGLAEGPGAERGTVPDSDPPRLTTEVISLKIERNEAGGLTGVSFMGPDFDPKYVSFYPSGRAARIMNLLVAEGSVAGEALADALAEGGYRLDAADVAKAYRHLKRRLVKGAEGHTDILDAIERAFPKARRGEKRQYLSVHLPVVEAD